MLAFFKFRFSQIFHSFQLFKQFHVRRIAIGRVGLVVRSCFSRQLLLTTQVLLTLHVISILVIANRQFGIFDFSATHLFSINMMVVSLDNFLIVLSSNCWVPSRTPCTKYVYYNFVKTALVLKSTMIMVRSEWTRFMVVHQESSGFIG